MVLALRVTRLALGAGLLGTALTHFVNIARAVPKRDTEVPGAVRERPVAKAIPTKPVADGSRADPPAAPPVAKSPNGRPGAPTGPGGLPTPGRASEIECLPYVTGSLSATPNVAENGAAVTRVGFQEPVVLSWEAPIPAGCPAVELALVNLTSNQRGLVAQKSTRTVHPMQPTQYQLTASAEGQTSILAKLRIEVSVPKNLYIDQGTAAHSALLEYALGIDNQVIRLAPTVELNMSHKHNIKWGNNVSLTGERGALGRRPLIYTNTKCFLDPQLPNFRCNQSGYDFFKLGNQATLTGIHLRGPAAGGRSKDELPGITGVSVMPAASEKDRVAVFIADNEIDEWPGAAVSVAAAEGGFYEKKDPKDFDPKWTTFAPADAGRIRVERNFIHHNARDGIGYGVTLGQAVYVLIEKNVFSHNRHALACGGQARTGYLAHYNYFLEGAFPEGAGFYNQHADVHGTGGGGYGMWAGEYFDVSSNTFRGEQSYYVTRTRPAFMLRGRAHQGAIFNSNVLVHDDSDAAIKLDGNTTMAWTGAIESYEQFNITQKNNKYNTDYSTEIAVGDFDGDARSDLFLANGTAWFFSSGGQAQWEFLSTSTKRTHQLAFADIDNDGKTDVLFRDGSDRLVWFESGRESQRSLTPLPVPISGLRSGDFDADGKTDLFYTKDGQWQVWYGKTKAWTPTASSDRNVAELAFGNFDGKPGTDVLGISGGKWQFSSSSTGSWEPLGPSRRSSLQNAVVADFDSDGIVDVAFHDGELKWVYSRSGREALATLKESSDQEEKRLPALHRLAIGHFDRNRGAEVITFPVYNAQQANTFPKNHLLIWRGGKDKRFEQVSWHEMR
jgi:hypothetical protein